MAGTWICSKNYAFDRGEPVPGAIAQFYSAQTLTPMVVYVDYGLTTPAGSFVLANGNGQWPVVYLDEGPGNYRYRTIRPDGAVLDDLTTLVIIGPGMGGGGGGGSSVDPSTIASTGDFKWRPQTAALTGWVRANGLTIGAAGSAGTERHNPDCQALFTYFWTNFTNAACPVSGGRGATALTDWGNNRTIGTPDLRGRAPWGLDGMGNTRKNILTNLTCANPDIVGGMEGFEAWTIRGGELPPHRHLLPLASATDVGGTLATIQFQPGAGKPPHQIGTDFGEGLLNTPHPNLPPIMVGTYFIKL